MDLGPGPRILAFGYESGTGKDTCASYASTHLMTSGKYKSVERRSFAYGLKEGVYRQFKHLGVKSAAYYETNRLARYDIIPALGIHVVDLWIAYGAKMREIKDEIFTTQTLSSLPEVLIISDLRFMTEVRELKALGAKLLKVSRDGIKKQGADYELDSYEGWDYFVDNNGTLKNLNDQLEIILKNERLL